MWLRNWCCSVACMIFVHMSVADVMPNNKASVTSESFITYQPLGCPYINDQMQQVCLWPSRLQLVALSKQLRFRQDWKVFKAGWVQLPGDPQAWPKKVSINKKPTLVTARYELPHIWLEPGVYQIQGIVPLVEGMKKVRVPASSAMIALTIDDKTFHNPQVSEGKYLPLNIDLLSAGSQQAPLTLQVFRFLHSDKPFVVDTTILLQVTGPPRVVNLSGAIFENAQVMSINSHLPTSLISENRLQVMLQAGQWQIKVKTRFLQQPKILTAMKPSVQWPNYEVWSVIEGSKLSAALRGVYPQVKKVDVLQSMPLVFNGSILDTRNIQLFRVPKDMAFPIVEYPLFSLPRNDLALTRHIWMDFQGEKFSFLDRIQGNMEAEWRFNADSEQLSLKAAANQNLDVLTLSKTSSPSSLGSTVGLNWRDENVDFIAFLTKNISEPSTTHFPVNGWNHGMQSVTTYLHTPPGWKLMAVWGADSVDGAWLNAWTVHSLFVLLVVSTLLFRVYGTLLMLVGFVALGTGFLALPITYSYLLCLMLILLMLLRPLFRLGYVIFDWLRGLLLVLSVLSLIIFSVKQSYALLLPQLPSSLPSMAFDHQNSKQEVLPTVLSSVSDIESTLTLTDLSAEASHYQIEQLKYLGFGIPKWRWHTASLTWKHSVGLHQNVSALWLSPLFLRLWHWLQFVSALMFAYLLWRYRSLKIRDKQMNILLIFKYQLKCVFTIFLTHYQKLYRMVWYKCLPLLKRIQAKGSRFFRRSSTGLSATQHSAVTLPETSEVGLDNIAADKPRLIKPSFLKTLGIVLLFSALLGLPDTIYASTERATDYFNWFAADGSHNAMQLRDNIRPSVNKKMPTEECQDSCVTVNKLQISLTPSASEAKQRPTKKAYSTTELTLSMQVEVAGRAAFAIPVEVDSWRHLRVWVDNKPAEALYRLQGKRLLLALDAGVHSVKLSSLLPTHQTVLSLNFNQSIDNVTTTLKNGWRLISQHDPQRWLGRIVFVRNDVPKIKNIHFKNQQNLNDGVVSQYKIERHLFIDDEWVLETRVTPIAQRKNHHQWKNVSVDLVLNEELMLVPEYIEKRGKDNNSLQLLFSKMPKNEIPRGLRWRSRISPSTVLDLQLSESHHQFELWSLWLGPRWSFVSNNQLPAEVVSVDLLQERNNNAALNWAEQVWLERAKKSPPMKNQTWLRYHWQSWPGARLYATINEQKKIVLPPLNVESMQLHIKPSNHITTYQAEVSVVTHDSHSWLFGLSKQAELKSVTLNQQPASVLRHEDGVILSLTSGRHDVLIQWQESGGMSWYYQLPEFFLKEVINNLTVLLAMPDNRTLIWSQGPMLGPTVVIWFTLFWVVLAISVLSYHVSLPIKAYEWVLLAVGFVWLSLWGLMAVVGWLLIIHWRGRLRSHHIVWLGSTRFNALQLALLAATLTLVVLILYELYLALSEMRRFQIAGRLSTQEHLVWYSDRVEQVLPALRVVSLPNAWCQLLLWLWAFWLGFVVVRWSIWFWRQIHRRCFWVRTQASSDIEQLQAELQEHLHQKQREVDAYMDLAESEDILLNEPASSVLKRS